MFAHVSPPNPANAKQRFSDADKTNLGYRLLDKIGPFEFGDVLVWNDLSVAERATSSY